MRDAGASGAAFDEAEAAPLPARLVPPREPLSAPRLLAAVVRNPVEAWPEAVYRDASYRSAFLGRETVFVMDPALVRGVLVERADAFEKAETLRRALRPALGDAILTADGARWRWQRRAAAPIFRHERILAFAPAMRAAARRTRDRLVALAEAGGSSGAVVDVAGEMMRATFDIIVATMLPGRGIIDVERVERAVTTYLESTSWRVALAMLQAPDWAPFPGRRRADHAGAYLRDEIARLVAAARAEEADEGRGDPGRGDQGRGDLLTLLVRARDPETGRAMEARDVVDNLLTFITAGHETTALETTALALAWTLYLLSLHPAAEARLLAEVAAAGEAAFGAEQGEALPYARAVVLEAMRLYPPAPVIVRRAIRDVVLDGPDGPVGIAAGGAAYVPVYAIHRHRALWADPDAFRPERHLPGAAPERGLAERGGYLPFGAGPRTCIGLGFALLEAGIILAEVLPALRFAAPDVPPHPRLRVTLRPRDGLPMRVARR